jgi:hypothetical protein
MKLSRLIQLIFAKDYNASGGKRDVSLSKLLWDSGNKNHSQFNLIKINTILHKYVCTLI